MDIGDYANEINDLHLERSLKNLKVETKAYSGFCLSCHEPVKEARYCDSDCRIDHERMLRLHRRK